MKTLHKQAKARNRTKQLKKQRNNTGGKGFYGHLTPSTMFHGLGGVFPSILRLTKEFLSRNPKDKAINLTIVAEQKKAKRKESQAKYRAKVKAEKAIIHKVPASIPEVK